MKIGSLFYVDGQMDGQTVMAKAFVAFHDFQTCLKIVKFR
jgi:hypothetical protein